MSRLKCFAVSGRRLPPSTKSKLRSRVGEINRDIVAAQHWQQILEIAMEHSSIYDSVNTSTSLHRIASKKPSEDDMQVRHSPYKQAA